jgi:hypothetical protein
MTSSSPPRPKRRFGGTCLHLQSRIISQERSQYESDIKHFFTLDSCLAFTSTLKIQATCSSGTSVGFRPTTQRCIIEDRTLFSNRSQNVKSYNKISFHIFLCFLYKNMVPRAILSFRQHKRMRHSPKPHLTFRNTSVFLLSGVVIPSPKLQTRGFLLVRSLRCSKFEF